MECVREMLGPARNRVEDRKLSSKPPTGQRPRRITGRNPHATQDRSAQAAEFRLANIVKSGIGGMEFRDLDCGQS